MALKLEHDPVDKVIRSIADHPGILASADTGDETVFGVTSSWDPRREGIPNEPGVITRVENGPNIPADFTPVTVDEVLDACTTIEVAQGVWYQAATTTAARAEDAIRHMDVAAIQRAVTLQAQVHAGFRDRGWIKAAA